MICTACAIAADFGLSLGHHCLLTPDDHDCTCQHRGVWVDPQTE